MDCVRLVLVNLYKASLACVASVSVQFGSKELQGSRPIFRAGKIPKSPFLGLSLLPNSTETLATQAIQNPGVCPQAVPSFPSPTPTVLFLALAPFSAQAKYRFLCSQTLRKRLLRRLKQAQSNPIKAGFSCAFLLFIQ